VFFGYVLTNAPIIVSVFVAQMTDKTLKGHWLNWFNMFLPVAVGTAGIVAYARLALQPDAHPAIFMIGPLLITALWFVLIGVLVMAYVFVPNR